MTKLAIIGAGHHAQQVHYPALKAVREINLCAACDLDQAKLDKVSEKYAVPAKFTDYREMLKKIKPDGVVIVMPPMGMADIAVECMKLGAHVMIEKPPGCSSAEASKMLQTACATNRKIMVSLNRRFVPLVRNIKNIADEHGGVIHCSATYNKYGFTGDAWKWPTSLALADAIHLIDLLPFICGQVDEVHCAARRLKADFVNSCSGLVTFKSGSLGSMNNHQCAGTRAQMLEVHAKGMSAYIDLGDTANPECKFFIKESQTAAPDSIPDDVTEKEIENTTIDAYMETRHFARWIQDVEPPESDLNSVMESVRLAEALAAGFHGKLADFQCN